jgi:hypothetical protein
MINKLFTIFLLNTIIINTYAKGQKLVDKTQLSIAKYPKIKYNGNPHGGAFYTGDFIEPHVKNLILTTEEIKKYIKFFDHCLKILNKEIVTVLSSNIDTIDNDEQLAYYIVQELLMMIFYKCVDEVAGSNFDYADIIKEEMDYRKQSVIAEKNTIADGFTMLCKGTDIKIVRIIERVLSKEIGNKKKAKDLLDSNSIHEDLESTLCTIFHNRIHDAEKKMDYFLKKVKPYPKTLGYFQYIINICKFRHKLETRYQFYQKKYEEIFRKSYEKYINILNKEFKVSMVTYNTPEPQVLYDETEVYINILTMVHHVYTVKNIIYCF